MTEAIALGNVCMDSVTLQGKKQQSYCSLICDVESGPVKRLDE